MSDAGDRGARKTSGVPRELLRDLLLSGTGRSLGPATRYRVVFLNAVTMTGGLMILLFAAISYASGNIVLGTAEAVAAAIVIANFLSLRLYRHWILGAVIDVSVIFIFFYYLVLSGGEEGSGVLWIMSFPLISLFLLGPVSGSAVTFAFLLAVALAVFMPSLNFAAFSPLYSLRILGAYSFAWLFGLVYEMMRIRTLAKLEASNVELARVTGELRDEKKRSDDILEGVSEGIFLLDGECRIGETYSRYLERIFSRSRLAGVPLPEILRSTVPERDMAAISDFFEILFSERVNTDLIREINPLAEIRCAFAETDGTLSERLLRFSFQRIGGPGERYPVLGTVHDASGEFELKMKLDEEGREHRRAMENLFRVIHLDPAMTKEFIADTEAELEFVNEAMRMEGASRKEILETAFQSVHSIKGNALLLGLEDFGAKVHDFEDSIRKLRDEGHEWRDLLSLTIGLGTIRKELDALKALIDKILGFQSEMREEGLAEATLFHCSMEKLMRKEAERTGMPCSISFGGFDGRTVPNSQRKLVKDIIVQFVRNSFAHGFEAPVAREALGKPRSGKISLDASWGATDWSLRYTDDGRGLDYEKIRAKAKKIPELSAKADSGDVRELAKMIFFPGFSTAGSVDLGSGRGMGMSFVHRRIADSGGKLSIKSQAGKGLEFVVTLPLPKS